MNSPNAKQPPAALFWNANTVSLMWVCLKLQLQKCFLVFTPLPFFWFSLGCYSVRVDLAWALLLNKVSFVSQKSSFLSQKGKKKVKTLTAWFKTEKIPQTHHQVWKGCITPPPPNPNMLSFLMFPFVFNVWAFSRYSHAFALKTRGVRPLATAAVLISVKVGGGRKRLIRRSGKIIKCEHLQQANRS